MTTCILSNSSVGVVYLGATSAEQGHRGRPWTSDDKMTELLSPMDRQWKYEFGIVKGPSDPWITIRIRPTSVESIAIAMFELQNIEVLIILTRLRIGWYA